MGDDEGELATGGQEQRGFKGVSSRKAE